MRERLEKRLTELKSEFEKGQRQLEEVEGKANALRNMLLRISGAIQVLEEELNAANSPRENGAHQPMQLESQGVGIESD